MVLCTITVYPLPPILRRNEETRIIKINKYFIYTAWQNISLTRALCRIIPKRKFQKIKNSLNTAKTLKSFDTNQFFFFLYVCKMNRTNVKTADKRIPLLDTQFFPCNAIKTSVSNTKRCIVLYYDISGSNSLEGDYASVENICGKLVA